MEAGCGRPSGFLGQLSLRRSPWDDDTVTIVIPEFVSGRLFSPTQLLHNQSAAALKLALLYRKDTVVTSVPYHVDQMTPHDGHARDNL